MTFYLFTHYKTVWLTVSCSYTFWTVAQKCFAFMLTHPPAQSIHWYNGHERSAVVQVSAPQRPCTCSCTAVCAVCIHSKASSLAKHQVWATKFDVEEISEIVYLPGLFVFLQLEKVMRNVVPRQRCLHISKPKTKSCIKLQATSPTHPTTNFAATSFITWQIVFDYRLRIRPVNHQLYLACRTHPTIWLLDIWQNSALKIRHFKYFCAIITASA